MSTIRVVNLQHTDATVPNIVLESDGTSVFASGITISGATTLTVSGTAEFASGTAAAPKITFIDDNDTGIYSPAANNLGITTNGTAALTIDASQQVGIGTTSPNTKLEIKGSDNVDVFGGLKITSNNQSAYVNYGWRGLDGSDQLRFSTGASERMRIDSAGRVGIGLSNPGDYSGVSKDLVVGNHSGARGITIAAENNNTGYLTWADGTNTTAEHSAGRIAYSHANDSMRFNTVATERMRIDNAGRVGIGITPAKTLDIKDTGNYGIVRADNSSASGGGAFIGNQNGTQICIFGVEGVITGNTANNAAIIAETGRGIRFYTNGTAASPKAEFLSGGGLTFNGDTAAANALDDYEEGTWTPVIKSGTNTITYSGGQQRFYYQKIGNHVTVTFSLNAATTSGTTGGGFTIEGLPFGSANISQLRTIGTHVIYYNTGLRATGWPNFVHLSSNTSTMEVYTKTSSAGAYDRANVDQVGSGSYFFWQLTYQTA